MQPGLAHDLRQFRERSLHHALVGPCAAADDGGWCLRWLSVGDQGGRDPGNSMQSHVKHERAGECGQRRIVESAWPVGVGLMARDKRHRRGMVAMRHRDTRIRAGRHRRGDAGNDLERNARRRKRRGLFAPPSKHERVAPFQTDHRLSRQRQLHQFAIDLRLVEIPTAWPLHATASLGRGMGMTEQQRVDEAVVEHHIRKLQTLDPAQRDQPGIPRPRPDEIHLACRLTHVVPAVSKHHHASRSHARQTHRNPPRTSPQRAVAIHPFSPKGAGSNRVRRLNSSRWQQIQQKRKRPFCRRWPVVSVATQFDMQTTGVPNLS